MTMDDISLRDFMEQRIKHLERRLDEALRTHYETHKVAEANVNRRLNDMNELRDQITGERGLYVTGAVLDARIAQVTAEYRNFAESNATRINLIEKQVANWQGRLIATGAIIGFLVAVAAIVIKLM